MNSLAIIGAGNMGAAFCKGLQDALPDLQLSIADRNDEKLKPFTDLQTSTNPSEIIDTAESVLIAVKPQSFDDCCLDIKEKLANKLLISIMAGKTLQTLEEKTGSNRVVRTMPNLGVAVGRGMTAWIGSDALSDEEVVFVKTILSSVGSEMQLKKEEAIDRFSVIAGCGPAYFFRLCSLLQQEAEKLGFSAEEARLMAEETFIASAELLNAETRTSAQMVTAVASKGGVTEAALKHFDEAGMDKMVAEALQKALKRSMELND